ncbi:MAG TPA: anti-sigma factor [Verrucomicrobiae bacterium]|nr:anti-sigma factor [Verrucomicrobiae bacterium]
MNCQQARLLIDAYADDELDPAGILELEKHLHDCPACALVFRNVQILKKSLKSDSLFFTAPTELRQKLKAELRPQTESTKPFRIWKWFTAVTASAAVICLALLLSLVLTRPSARQQLAQEIVSSHIRSLMANHEMDVASSDQHTVKPWFDGKLDFSPPVKDLAAQGFPLTGGRLDYLGNRAVAALVFHRAKHVINLFVWPTKEGDSEPAVVVPINGYNLIHWARGGMTFWAVSDLNERELMEFARDFGAN